MLKKIKNNRKHTTNIKVNGTFINGNNTDNGSKMIIYNLKAIKDNSFNSKIMEKLIRKLNLIYYYNRKLIQDTWNRNIVEMTTMKNL